MKISIVTTTYNSAKTVRDTLDSIVSQTYEDWELLIVDGGSKDNTLEIVKEYEGKYPTKIFTKSEPDKGIYDAFNKGVLRATGEVVGILNSDDMFANEEALETIANALTKRNVDCVFGNLLMVFPDNTDKIFRVWEGSPYKKNNFQKGWQPAHPTFYCKKECYDKYGLYDLSFKISADFELMLRFIERYKISTYFINEYLVKMRAGGESNGTIRNILQGRENQLRAFKVNGFKVNGLSYYVKRMVPKVLNILKTKVQNMYGE